MAVTWFFSCLPSKPLKHCEAVLLKAQEHGNEQNSLICVLFVCDFVVLGTKSETLHMPNKCSTLSSAPALQISLNA